MQLYMHGYIIAQHTRVCCHSRDNCKRANMNGGELQCLAQDTGCQVPSTTKCRVYIYVWVQRANHIVRSAGCTTRAARCKQRTASCSANRSLKYDRLPGGENLRSAGQQLPGK
jgi:hypothetical protein